MVGTPLIGAWIAQLAFWVLLALGVTYGELGRCRALMFAALWLVGYVGLPRVSALGGLFVTSYVAVLDIVLVFIVFRRDLRIG